MRRAFPIAVAALAAVTVARAGIAARWDLLADEAYHWTWALDPALGYYDQPPLVAWVLAGARTIGGDHALALRLPAIVGWSVAVGALARHTRWPDLWGWWALALPPLVLLTQLAVPDGLLLPLWALGLAGAARGGRGWWWAGIAGGLASLAKYTGMALVPLLVAGCTPAERRTRDPWIALGLALALVAPNLAWNAGHGWVTFGFQLQEGLLSPNAPGWSGPVRQILDQALLAGPVAAAVGAVWMVRSASGWSRLDRIDRLCLATSAPLAIGFAVAAFGGPPEAHWPAPAWIGVGVGLARAGGRLARGAYLGAVFGAVALGAAVVHAERPVVPLVHDPATRLTEGRALAGIVALWVVPAAADGGRQQRIVYTERYQEAALLRWYGIAARTLPGCGRRSQDDLQDSAGRPFQPEPAAWFLRPARSGPPACARRWFGEALSGPHPLRPLDPAGRAVGAWDLFEAGAP